MSGTGTRGWVFRVQGRWNRVLVVLGYLTVTIVCGPLLGTISGTFLWFGIEAGFWLIVVRAFRSTWEDRDPARPWWRGTYTPAASWALAVYMLLGVIGSIAIFTQEVQTTTDFGGAAIDSTVVVVFDLCATVYFINSASRLHRIEHARTAVDVAADE